MLVNKGLEAGKKGRLQNPCMSRKDQRKQGGNRKGAGRGKDLGATSRMDKFKWKTENFSPVGMAEMGFWESRYCLETICKICICVFHWKEDT